MCVNARWIYNPYCRKKILVKCGKCDACLQEKALARTQRIKNNLTSGQLCLFITLTYSNDYVPYVLRSDLLSESIDINVYRSCTGRFVYSPKRGLFFKKERGIELVDNIYIPIECRCSGDIMPLKHLQGCDSEKIGVCISSDIQKFFKRLSQILKRNYEILYPLNYYYCSEYGSFTHRPHFHALLYIRTSDEKAVREAIIKAWPYADSTRTSKYIEIARDAASYVASYVNSKHSLLPVLQESNFRQKHNYSRGFGVALDCFQLDSILAKIESGDLYYYRRKVFDGVTDVVPQPIPAYVINRYFPKFKGISRLSDAQLSSILICPDKVYDVLFDGTKKMIYESSNKLIEVDVNYHNKLGLLNYDYSEDETRQICVRLENAFQRFKDITGLNRFDYAFYFMRAWRVLFAVNMKFLHCPPNDAELPDYNDFYDNNLDVLNGDVSSPTLELAKLSMNPNARKDIKEKTISLSQIFDKKDKQRKVTNFALTALGHYV